MELGDLEWGDVLHQEQGLVVCEALLADEEVVVKRWQQGLLDDELAARREMQRAGLHTRPMLGSGAGWLVLEDLGGSMWRSAGRAELSIGGVPVALGDWYASVHRLEGASLSVGPWQALLDDRLLGEIPVESGAAVDPVMLQWRVQHDRAALESRSDRLVVGAPLDSGVLLLAGQAAMVDDLSGAHRGWPAEDLLAVLDVLDEGGRRDFLDAYGARTGISPAELLAEVTVCRRLLVMARWVAQVLSGSLVEPGLAAQMQGLLELE